MNEDQRDAAHTTDGKEPATPEAGAPQPLNPKTGQYGAYWVLSEEERKGGLVRPLRLTYRHVGLPPKYPTRELTEEETGRYSAFGYVCFEAYPEDSPESQEGNVTGRFLTSKQLSSGCGQTTKMSLAIAQTYAKKPDFYGATFCAVCAKHLPVGERGEFIWDDGSGERVGT